MPYTYARYPIAKGNTQEDSDMPYFCAVIDIPHAQRSASRNGLKVAGWSFLQPWNILGGR